MQCLVCLSKTIDRAHVKTKGSGGTWDDWNIMPLCRIHHIQQHRIGIVTFALKYPQVLEHLEQKGWEIQDQFGRKRLVRKV